MKKVFLLRKDRYVKEIFMDDEERNRKRMQMIAIYATLPFIIGIPPIVGWFIGSWIDKHFDTKPYGMYILLALGVIAGAREFYRIIMKYKDEEIS